VGESLEQNERGVTQAFISGQVKAALAGFTAEQVATSSSPTSRSGRSAPGGRRRRSRRRTSAAALCAQPWRALLGEEAAATIRCSLRRQRQRQEHRRTDAQPDIDGALIGGAALKVESYAAMVKTTSELY
jgi:triosephosphate isomerase